MKKAKALTPYGKRKPKAVSPHHCVIGASVSENSFIGRTWLTTEGDAVDHAKRLLSKNAEERPSGSRLKRLLVVKVVAVVEVPEQKYTARAPKKGERMTPVAIEVAADAPYARQLTYFGGRMKMSDLIAQSKRYGGC